MAPPVDPSTAKFYVKKEFEGDEYPYSIGADVSVPGSLNDKFLSVNVGNNTKVIAWQHYNESGVYREWEGANPDISDIGGLSRFKVVENNTRAISFQFVDQTGGTPLQYSLKIDARDVGTVLIKSNEDPLEWHLVGILPAGGPPVTTGVFLRNEGTGVYLSVGSIYFQWNKDTNEVDIVESEAFPPQLKYTRKGPSAFEIALIDNTPSQ
ncbi:Beta/Gamma crystallin-domain-containing protein [Cercophora samala]|uniref:Beta/Gamma crystallin-domain-containing protein n=1 Tax=Cercophora samala TaxID=330535 RepID=A0AA39YER2_9PEZI|nr:Beta/Gamma crystallin-domain-containing protein [Cercophora samala]